MTRAGTKPNANRRPGSGEISLERRVRTLLGGDEGIDEMVLVVRDIVRGKNRLCDACKAALTPKAGCAPCSAAGRVLASCDQCLQGAAAQDGCKCQKFAISTRDRLLAFGLVTERGWGKPRQHVEISEPSPADDLTLLSEEELVALAKAAEDDERAMPEAEGDGDAPEPGRAN